MSVHSDIEVGDRAALRLIAIEALPAVEGDDPSYAESVATLLDDQTRTELLSAVLTELWRRIAAAGETPVPILRASAHRIQARLLDERETQRATRVRDEERREPLRARLLHHLAEGSASPRELAARFERTPESVSRALRTLSEEGLVTFTVDPQDARKRNYRRVDAAAETGVDDDMPAWLTASGAVERRNHAAHGGRLPRDRPAEQAALERYVRNAIAAAVADRRHSNALEGAIERLRSLTETCEQAGLGPLEINARRELATTLRRAGRSNDHRAQVRKLLTAARGRRPDLGGDVALPAFGHYTYERGRAARGGDRQMAASLRHLVTSAGTFEQLCALDEHNEEWRKRKAWATYAIADLSRQQTLIDPALKTASIAAQLFHDVSDDYGLASSVFLAGFCLRLRGDFEGAESVITAARGMTEDHGFGRLRAECLMQLGETQRCRGALDGAADTLAAAVVEASALKHEVTEAFAHSSLGAVAYERGDLVSAEQHLALAHDRFGVRNHRSGLALNLRRTALVRLARGKYDGTVGATSSAILRQLGDAQRRFGSLHSPAGVLSCKIGRTQVLTELHGADHHTVHDACSDIVTWFDQSPRYFIYAARDPWVLPLVQDVAEQADHDELGAASTLLMHHAASERSERTRRDWQPVRDLIGASKVAKRVRTVADWMGGESRRQVSVNDAAALPGSAG